MPLSAADDVRAVCARQHHISKLREQLAHDLWLVWLATPDGRRYGDAVTAGRRDEAVRLAPRGWSWVACQVRLMAARIEDAGMDDDATRGDARS